ncbi:MAG: hypothetical protein ACTS73_08465 [Arsenophonus sp. NEOnobi-MAG3]
MLLIISVTEHGRKKLVALKDAYLESKANLPENFSITSCEHVWLNRISPHVLLRKTVP